MKLVNTHILFLILLFAALKFDIVIAQEWSLNQCIDTALVYNKNLQMNRNTVSMSEERQNEAKAQLIPKITANADYKYYTNLPYQFMPLSTFNPSAPEGQFKEAQFGVPHNINATVQVSMTLYNPLVYGAIQNTKTAVELTELNLKKSEEQIYFDISNLYYNAQILSHQVVFIDSNLINAKRLLVQMQLLNDQLLAKGSDVSKVKLQVAQLTSQKESIHSKYEQVINGLKFSMGIDLDKTIEVESTILKQQTTEYSPKLRIETSILNTQNKLLTNELNTLNNSRFLPSINLFASYGTMGFGYDKKPNNFLTFYPVGFASMQLSYPLFNGTITSRKINQKKIELQNNALQSSLLSDQNTMQIENAFLQRKIAKASIETMTEQITLAQTIYTQTLLQQKQGTANLTDILLADNSLRESQQLYLSALIDYLKADLELQKLTGNISIKE